MLDEGHVNWTLLLLAGALLLLVGVAAWVRDARWAPWLVALGHVVLAGCCLAFTISIIGSAIEFDEPWSGAGPLALITLLHAERTLCAGTNIGRT